LLLLSKIVKQETARYFEGQLPGIGKVPVKDSL